jgi:hypothetical protein
VVKHLEDSIDRVGRNLADTKPDTTAKVSDVNIFCQEISEIVPCSHLLTITVGMHSIGSGIPMDSRK